VRGAPITVKCDCGQIQYVPYGERWECPGCDRVWDTGQIPEAEYWGIMHEMRRYRLQVIAAALAIFIPLGVLGFLAGPRFFLMIPVAMGAWFFFYMPRWRRKVRTRARNLPTWQLHPE
jgi:hypothetical protein